MSRDSVNPYKGLCEKTGGILFPFPRGEFTVDEEQRFRELCKRFDKIYCEVGSGSGGHLIEQAKRDPGSLFIGFELRFKRAYRSYEKSLNAGLSNIAFLRTDAEDLARFFGEGSLSGVFVNFPDPWEKQRWRKHRLLDQAYLDIVIALLKSDGFLSFKTDHANYFESVFELIRKMPNFAVNYFTRSLHQSDQGPFSVESEFEKLFKSKGLPVHYVLAQKTSRAL